MSRLRGDDGDDDNDGSGDDDSVRISFQTYSCHGFEVLSQTSVVLSGLQQFFCSPEIDLGVIAKSNKSLLYQSKAQNLKYQTLRMILSYCTIF
mmetsp:Transcript_90858/g.185136  ORF Transcript_90858/g.185136 Transcript_90858/m.185136 type:complete len:93 (-) Transcript_90858:21-299(-)